MDFTLLFLAQNALLGVGLSMDAFSISLANGLTDSDMKLRKVFFIAFVFAFAQFLMPMIGWVCVHTIAEHFSVFQKIIPWIALLLLGYIGGGMLFDGIKNRDSCESAVKTSIGAILVQGIATSIDALSVGFTISEYTLPMALAGTLIIGLVTFFICFSGVLIGKRFGTCLANKASILGGAILIFIGLEIFISSFF